MHKYYSYFTLQAKIITVTRDEISRLMMILSSVINHSLSQDQFIIKAACLLEETYFFNDTCVKPIFTLLCKPSKHKPEEVK